MARGLSRSRQPSKRAAETGPLPTGLMTRLETASDVDRLIGIIQSRKHRSEEVVLEELCRLFGELVTTEQYARLIEWFDPAG